MAIFRASSAISRNIPLIGFVNPVKYSPGACAGARPPCVTGLPALVQYAEVADQALQCPAVARRRDHRVRGDPGAVRQDRLAVVEGLQRGDRFDLAGAYRVDQADVLDRDRALADPGVQARVRARQALFGEVGDGDPGT